MEEEAQAWLALSSIRQVGSRALWRIAEWLSSNNCQPSDVIAEWSRVREELGLTRTPQHLGIPPEGLADLPSEVTVLHPTHRRFPAHVADLARTHSLPAVLYAYGRLDLLDELGVAIVGARDADRQSLDVVRWLAEELASRNVNIVSGKARGVDRCAHDVALESGGTTTAVLSEGILRAFGGGVPSEGAIPEQVLLLSQFEPHAAWSAPHAMSRNRLVCALSRAVVVVACGPERDEAGRKSGTFHAGTVALDMGIPLFVVSPSVLSAGQAEGNAELISRGGVEWAPGSGIESIARASPQPQQQTCASPTLDFD